MNANRNSTTTNFGWIVQLYFPELKRWENYSRPLPYEHAVHALERVSGIANRKCRLRKVVIE